MNFLCNEGGFVGKFVNEGGLGLPRGRHFYEGDWSQNEGASNGGALATMTIMYRAHKFLPS